MTNTVWTLSYDITASCNLGRLNMALPLPDTNPTVDQNFASNNGTALNKDIRLTQAPNYFNQGTCTS